VLSFDGGNSWVQAGTSDNPMYVTAGIPIPDPNSGKLYYTVVEQAVLHTIGDFSQTDIVAGTWSAFTGLNKTTGVNSNFQRADGTPLQYYGNYDPSTYEPDTNNTTVGALLQDGNGQCSTWAGLFLDMLLVNGVVVPNDYIVVSTTSGEGFLVNNWSFVGKGVDSRVTPRYPYVIIPAQTVTNQLGDPVDLPGFADAIDDPGVVGQNSANPDSLFGNHQLVQINGVLYDPSYGVTYTSIADMNTKVIVGYFIYIKAPVVESRIGVDLNNDGNTTDIFYNVKEYEVRRYLPNSPTLLTISRSFTWDGIVPQDLSSLTSGIQVRPMSSPVSSDTVVPAVKQGVSTGLATDVAPTTIPSVILSSPPSVLGSGQRGGSVRVKILINNRSFAVARPNQGLSVPKPRTPFFMFN